MSKHKQKHNNNQIQSCTLFVDGMHCASCEVLIEKKIIKHEGIESVDASLSDGKVQILYTGNSKPEVSQLNEEFSALGYQFSNSKFSNREIPLFSLDNGNITYNPQKIGQLFKSLMILASLVVLFFLFQDLELGQYINVDSNASLTAFLLLGVVAGLSSCAALIGGLLLSMTKQWNELYIDSESNVQKASPHIMFHLGRVVSFTVLGGALGLLGELVSVQDTTVFAIFTIVISAVMLLLALQMLEVSWAQKIRFTAPKALTKYAAEESNFKGKLMPFGIGAMTFLLPCGFTLIAQTAALTSGSFVQGGLIMLAFSLGTLPTLLAISYSGLIFNSRPHLTARFNNVVGLLLVFFVIYNVNAQLNVLGLPSLSDIKFEYQAPQTVVEKNDAGTQVLNFVAKGFDYIPTGSTTIKAGVPTTLVVDNQGIQGCGTFMAARGLIDNFVALKPGINEIDLGSPARGSYKLTCSMGMVPPVTITVI